METVYAARFFRCELSLYRYGYVSARFETADKTVRASRYMSALLNFAAHPIVFPLRSVRGRCRLRQMRCYYIRAVGATLFQYVSVLPELKSIAVGNGFIRSAYTGLVGSFRSG